MMSKKLIPAIFCASLATACSSNPENVAESASPTAETQQVAVQADARDPEAIRCKRYAETGSRIGKKVCMTNAEWDKTAEASREAVERIQRSSVQGGMEGG